MKRETPVKAVFVGNKIWDGSRVHDRDKTRMELTDLIRFKGHWYCSFREGFIHHNHPSGRGRIIRSADGEKWESVFLKEWDGADVRECKLSVTGEGLLMANTALAFVSKEARSGGGEKGFEVYDRPLPGGGQYGNYYQLDKPGTPADDLEMNVARQSVTWLSDDGIRWSSAYACPSGVNTWRWSVTWHNGMGYSVAYGGKDGPGTLYRTRDGKSWNVLRDRLFPQAGIGSEAALAFDADNTAYCLLRDARLRAPAVAAAAVAAPKDVHAATWNWTSEKDFSEGTYGKAVPMLGIGKPPYYQEWEWKDVEVDWEGGGRFTRCDEALRAEFGGPQLLRLEDGRFVAVGRNLRPGRPAPLITLFWLDPAKARLTVLADCAGTTYGAAVEHQGTLWVSYAGKDTPGTLAIFLAKIGFVS